MNRIPTNPTPPVDRGSAQGRAPSIKQPGRGRAGHWSSQQIEINAIAPFDFDLALRYLRAWPATMVERIDDARWRRVVTIGKQDLLLSLRAIGTVRKPRLLLEVQGRELSPQLMQEARALVARAFGLEVDPTPFLRAIRADPVLAAVVERLHVVRPLLIIDPFEAIVWGILCQQINLAFGRRLKQALIDLCGRHLEIGGAIFSIFPRPQDVLTLTPEVLRTHQFSRQKSAYLAGVAQAVISGELDFAGLAALPADEAMARLVSIKGIGRWTAEYMMARALGFLDAIAAADIGLRRIIGRAYGLGRLASEAEVRERAERWAGWRGWAAFYWWMNGLMDSGADRLTTPSKA